MQLCLVVASRHAFKAAEEDWEKDSEGKTGLDQDRFFWCWFELADLWTDSIAPAAYVDFLQVRSHASFRQNNV